MNSDDKVATVAMSLLALVACGVTLHWHFLRGRVLQQQPGCGESGGGGPRGDTPGLGGALRYPGDGRPPD